MHLASTEWNQYLPTNPLIKLFFGVFPGHFFELNSDSALVCTKLTSSRGLLGYLPSLWMCLVGLPRFTTSLWQDEDAGIVEEAGEYFSRVSSHMLTSPHNAVHFLSWLSETSAKGIRDRLLKPVADVGLVASDRWWKERHLARLMARYLGLVWHEHAPAFEQDAEQKKVFLSLVHRTARTQEPLAMELQNRMAARSDPKERIWGANVRMQ